MLDNETMELEDVTIRAEMVDKEGINEQGTSEVKNHKRKLKVMVDDDGRMTILAKLYKRIVLSLTKPSYCLGLGATNVRRENRAGLFKILRPLVRGQNWTEASGVLSVLLKGTSKDQFHVTNRFKFLVSMGLLKRIQGDRDISQSIKNIYDIWTKRIERVKDQTIEVRLMVHMEFIVTLLTQGYVDEAYDATLSLKQQNEFGSHPMSYMVMGMTLYQLWYSGIPKEMQWKDSDQIYTSSQLDMSGAKFYNNVGNSEGHDSVYSHESDSQLRYDSVASVMNDARISMEADSDIHREVSMEADSDIHREVSMEVDVNLHRENSSEEIQPRGLYMNSDDSEACFDNNGGHMDYAIFSVLVGLDAWLFPLRLPHSTEDSEGLIHLHREIVNDHYKDAVKYLRLALYSKTPVLTVLFPLIQLLLIGGKVNEALSELEKFSSSANTALPIRLRTSLLECFDRNNYVMLSTCFEDSLRKDPTCCYSLAKLISMHQNGIYNTESLLEMTALHLDATYAEYNTWRVFALCFLELSHYEEDRLSVCLNENEDGQTQVYSARYSRTPKILTQGKSGKGWRFRCKWWLKHHFKKNMLASETAAGDLQLLTYKAACASHMYGKDFKYVVKAYTCLQTDNTRDLLTFLKMHMQYSIGLHLSFQQCTKL